MFIMCDVNHRTVGFSYFTNLIKYLVLVGLIGLVALIIVQVLKGAPSAIHSVSGVVTHILTTTTP